VGRDSSVGLATELTTSTTTTATTTTTTTSTTTTTTTTTTATATTIKTTTVAVTSIAAEILLLIFGPCWMYLEYQVRKLYKYLSQRVLSFH
jgi:hypothetical protein